MYTCNYDRLLKMFMIVY